MDGMNNKEYTEAYLYWSAEGVDRTVEAFDRHLQAVSNENRIHTVITHLEDLRYNYKHRDNIDSDTGWLRNYIVEVDTTIQILEGL